MPLAAASSLVAAARGVFRATRPVYVLRTATRGCSHSSGGGVDEKYYLLSYTYCEGILVSPPHVLVSQFTVELEHSTLQEKRAPFRPAHLEHAKVKGGNDNPRVFSSIAPSAGGQGFRGVAARGSFR